MKIDLYCRRRNCSHVLFSHVKYTGRSSVRGRHTTANSCRALTV